MTIASEMKMKSKSKRPRSVRFVLNLNRSSCRTE